MQFELTTNTITNNPQQAILIYPNPAKDMVYFQTQANYSIQIINSIGQIVLCTHSSKSNSIDLSGLRQGMYFLKFYNEKETILKKLNIE